MDRPICCEAARQRDRFEVDLLRTTTWGLLLSSLTTRSICGGATTTTTAAQPPRPRQRDGSATTTTADRVHRGAQERPESPHDADPQDFHCRSIVSLSTDRSISRALKVKRSSTATAASAMEDPAYPSLVHVTGEASRAIRWLDWPRGGLPRRRLMLEPPVAAVRSTAAVTVGSPSIQEDAPPIAQVD